MPLHFTSFFILLAVIVTSSFSCWGATEERTLAMIKPDGVSGNYNDRIKKVIQDSGFSITRELTIHLDEESVRTFYAEHSSKSFFVNLIKYMTSGPVLVLVLEKDNAVADWRKLIGPTDADKARVSHPQSGSHSTGFTTQSSPWIIRKQPLCVDNTEHQGNVWL